MAKYKPIEDGLVLDSRSGIYYVRKFHAGKRCHESTTTTNLYKARLEKTRIITEYFGSRAVGHSVTFSAYADEILTLYEGQNKKTYDCYEGAVRLHLKPYFSDHYLDEIGRDWKRYVANEKKESDRKLRHDRMTMSVILHHALTDELIEAVPGLPIPREDREPTPGREYTNTEINGMLGAKPNLSLHNSLQVHTGMRSGECDKLKWEYIDFERGLIRLPPEIIKNRYGRIYPVDPGVLEELKVRFPNSSEYVFPHRHDKTRHKTPSDAQWQRLKKKLGVTGKRHWLRHTAVTRMIRAGAEPTMVQKALGMSDQVMKRVYLHSNEDDTLKLATAVSRSLRGGQ